MDQVKALADRYNAIGAESKKAGLQQGLHTEGFELSMVNGKRVFDVLFDLLDPQLVRFQFQMSTITSGLVAADYFTQHPNRFISMHLQDLDMNAPVAPPTPAPPGGRAGRGGRPSKPVGQGSIDWVKTFKAAEYWRRAELLHRDERATDACQRAVSEDADGLSPMAAFEVLTRREMR